MSTITMTLQECITATGGITTVEPDGVRVLTGGDIGIQYYKTFIPAHKRYLDGLILDRYFMREIGVETPQLFSHLMRSKLNEIMPYYNKLYESETFAFDPLTTIKLTTKRELVQNQNVNVNTETAAESANDTKSRTIQSQFPQTMLSSMEDYATNGADTNSQNNGSSNGNEVRESDSVTDENTDTTVDGYQAYPSNLIQQYRAIQLNIDLMIINELDENFMSLLNVGDTYTPQGFALGGSWPFYPFI